MFFGGFIAKPKILIEVNQLKMAAILKKNGNLKIWIVEPLKLNNVMQEQGIWDDEKEAQYNAVLEQISDGEKTLNGGGISLSEARDVALSMRRSRSEFRALIAERSSMDTNTAEGQADNERFSHLVYTCLLDERGERVFIF